MIGSVEERVLKLADALRTHKDPNILTKIIASRKKLGTLFASDDAYLKVDCADETVVAGMQSLFPSSETRYRNYLFNVVVRRLIAEFEQAEPNWETIDRILSLHPKLLALLFEDSLTPEQDELVGSLLSTSVDEMNLNSDELGKIFQKNNLIYLFNSGLKIASIIDLLKTNDSVSKQIIRFVESPKFLETIKSNHQFIIAEGYEFNAQTLIDFYSDYKLCTKPVLDSLISEEALKYYRNGGFILNLKEVIQNNGNIPEKPSDEELAKFEEEDKIEYNFADTTNELRQISPELHIWNMYFAVQIGNVKIAEKAVAALTIVEPPKPKADTAHVVAGDDDENFVPSVAAVADVSGVVAALPARAPVEQPAEKVAEPAQDGAVRADNNNNAVDDDESFVPSAVPAAPVNSVLAAVATDDPKTSSTVTPPPQTTLATLSTSTATSSSSLSANSAPFTPAPAPAPAPAAGAAANGQPAQTDKKTAQTNPKTPAKLNQKKAAAVAAANANAVPGRKIG